MPSSQWVLQNLTRVHSPTHRKTSQLTVGCGEAEYSISIADPKQRGWAGHTQETQTPRWLSGEGVLLGAQPALAESTQHQGNISGIFNLLGFQPV